MLEPGEKHVMREMRILFESDQKLKFVRTISGHHKDGLSSFKIPSFFTAELMKYNYFFFFAFVIFEHGIVNQFGEDEAINPLIFVISFLKSWQNYFRPW